MTTITAHPFAPNPDAPPAMIGSDGRRFLACVDCGRSSRDEAHAGYWVRPMLTDDDRHAYRAGPTTIVDGRGASRALCAQCGKVANSLRHRDAFPAFVADRMHESIRAAIVPPQARRTPRPSRARPRVELVTRPWLIDALLDAADRLLALEGDDVSWSVRVRLVDLRRAVLMDWPDMAPPEPSPLPGDEARRVVSPAVPGSPPPANLAPRTVQAPPVGSPVRAARKLRRAFASSDMRDLFDAAMDQGFMPRKQGDGHVRFIRGSYSFSMSTTDPGNGRGLANARANARRAGLEL